MTRAVPKGIHGRPVENHQTLRAIVGADVRRRRQHIGRTLTGYHARKHVRDVLTETAANVRDVIHGGPIRRRVQATATRVGAAIRWDRRARRSWRAGDTDVASMMGGGGPQRDPGPECGEWSHPLTVHRQRGARLGSCQGCRDWVPIPFGHEQIPPHEPGPPTIDRCPYCGRMYPEGRGPWYTDPPCRDCARGMDRDAILNGRTAGDPDDQEDEHDVDPDDT